MPRVHLLELEDLPWFPSRLRDLMTDALSGLQRAMGLHRTMAGLLRAALEESRSHELLDLCSGAGGVLPKLHAELARQDYPVKVLFTDRYPNREALAATCRRAPDVLDFCPEPVDATAIPEQFAGFRTLFTSFHHFRPPAAAAILRNAFEARAGIAIFEITERSWAAFVRNAFTPLACWLVTPRIRPLTMERLLFTYVVPIVPLALTWDGFVSNLRTYTPSELREMTAALSADDYEWRIGKVRGAMGQVTTYLIGLSRPSAAQRAEQKDVQHQHERDCHHVHV